MSAKDDFVFQYLLPLNESYWPLRNLPRDEETEQKFIRLGRKECVLEHDEPALFQTLWPFSTTVWEQLGLEAILLI